MLAIAAQLDLVARLLAVIAAVLPEWSLRLDCAVAGRVSALHRSSHVDPPFVRPTVRLFIVAHKIRKVG